jgi:hydroxyacylglutathione hydrolase
LSWEEKNILIDSGPPRLWEVLKHKLNKRNLRKIDYLILTHTHFDHAGNATNIKGVFGARVIVHKNEATIL